jgi:hypothetical protein
MHGSKRAKLLQTCVLVVPSGQGQLTVLPTMHGTGSSPSLLLSASTIAEQPAVHKAAISAAQA